MRELIDLKWVNFKGYSIKYFSVSDGVELKAYDSDDNLIAEKYFSNWRVAREWSDIFYDSDSSEWLRGILFSGLNIRTVGWGQ